jgi:hypothetical protein
MTDGDCISGDREGQRLGDGRVGHIPSDLTREEVWSTSSPVQMAARKAYHFPVDKNVDPAGIRAQMPKAHQAAVGGERIESVRRIGGIISADQATEVSTSPTPNADLAGK